MRENVEYKRYVVDQEEAEISKDEVRIALKRMKTGRAVGPDIIPVEEWMCLIKMAVQFLTRFYNRILKTKKMPKECRKSALVPIFKNEGDLQIGVHDNSIAVYIRRKLMSHTM